MRHHIGWLPLGLIACLGCGGSPPALPETEAQGAARVFAVAKDLEETQKTKQAIAAYHQIMRYYPNTLEARKSADRITKLQRDATRQATARKRK
jgi:hypothetical protein